MDAKLFIELVERGPDEEYFSTVMLKKLRIMAKHYSACKICADLFDEFIKGHENSKDATTLESIFNPFNLDLEDWICGKENKKENKNEQHPN